jgi:hypothetical protein
MTHLDSIFITLTESGIPYEDAKQAAQAMAAKQMPHLPASQALPALIAAFVELYKLSASEALETLGYEAL